MMTDLKLPPEMVDFFNRKLTLNYDFAEVEAGRLGLKALSDLKIEAIWVNSDGVPELEDDPNEGEDGYYEIPAISLTGECDSYDPEFILLWLPHEQMFGSWDCDHWNLFVFPETSWNDLTENPARYLNTQWTDQHEHCRFYKPYPKYPFLKGMPF